MHFCTIILGVCLFCYKVVRKATKKFMPIGVSTWQGTKKHYKKHTIKTQVLAFQRFLKMAPNPIPLPLTRLHCAQALTHAGEYARTVCALALSTFMAPLVKTIATLHHLHPLVEVDLPPFVNDFI